MHGIITFGGESGFFTGDIKSLVDDIQGKKNGNELSLDLISSVLLLQSSSRPLCREFREYMRRFMRQSHSP